MGLVLSEIFNVYIDEKFHEIKRLLPIVILYTVWSLRNFCITWKIFREINFTVKLFTKEVVLTEIFQKTRDTKISETPH